METEYTFSNRTLASTLQGKGYNVSKYGSVWVVLYSTDDVTSVKELRMLVDSYIPGEAVKIATK